MPPPRCAAASARPLAPRSPEVKLATILPPGGGSPLAAEVRGDVVHPYDPGTTVLGLLAAGGEPPAATGDGIALDGVTLLAPLPEPRVLYGVGLNYAGHAAEQGAELPSAPIIFTMQPGSAAPPFGEIVCPPVVRRLDYEGELAVIIGAGGRIAGYAVANDVSARDLQKRERQWTRAKGFDGACPFGPWITTADEIADPLALHMQVHVNGELRQDSSTGDMIFSPQQVCDFLAETCTLHPGDVILTGTPEGVGPMEVGDEVEVFVQGIGNLTSKVVKRD